MARLARIVVSGLPHHVTQRGVRRMQVFFCDADYRMYLRILAHQAATHALEVWAYCLMPNHVHLIAVPSDREGLALTLAEAHRSYAAAVNRRSGWTGHLWQERFWSFPIDQRRLLGSVQYVLLNPVRAGLTSTAVEWPYSSARAHLTGRSDGVVHPARIAAVLPDPQTFLSQGPDQREIELVRRHQKVGRPLGEDDFVDDLERITGRRLRAGQTGRKRRPEGRSGDAVVTENE